MLFPNDSRCMTYDEKSQKSHTSSIPSEHKVLILTKMRRNRKSFHDKAPFSSGIISWKNTIFVNQN